MMMPAPPHIVGKESYQFECKMNEIWSMQIPIGNDGKIDHSILYNLIHNLHSYPLVSFDCKDGIVIIFYKGNRPEK